MKASPAAQTVCVNVVSIFTLLVDESDPQTLFLYSKVGVGL